MGQGRYLRLAVEGVDDDPQLFFTHRYGGAEDGPYVEARRLQLLRRFFQPADIGYADGPDGAAGGIGSGGAEIRKKLLEMPGKVFYPGPFGAQAGQQAVGAIQVDDRMQGQGRGINKRAAEV